MGFNSGFKGLNSDILYHHIRRDNFSFVLAWKYCTLLHSEW